MLAVNRPISAGAGPMYTQVAQGTFTGSYSFSNIAPGSYRVVFDGAAGYQRSPTGAGSDAARDSDAGQTDGATGCFTLVSGQQKTDVDAGYYQRVPALCAGWRSVEFVQISPVYRVSWLWRRYVQRVFVCLASLWWPGVRC